MRQKLKYYVDIWSLSDSELLAQTRTSSLFKVIFSGRPAVLKLLSAIGEIDERWAGQALAWYAGEGAVTLLKASRSAMLLEYVDGEHLSELVQRGWDEDATGILADVLCKLHTCRAGSVATGLPMLRDRFSSLFALGDRSAPGDAILRRGAEVAVRLLESQGQIAVLHGDLHHRNIKLSSERGWLAIDPKGLVGEREYDGAIALCNPLWMPETVQSRERLLKHAAIIANRTHVNLERLIAYVFAYACLSACWSIEDGESPSHALRMAEISETFLS